MDLEGRGHLFEELLYYNCHCLILQQRGWNVHDVWTTPSWAHLSSVLKVLWSSDSVWDIISQMPLLYGIFTYIYPKNYSNVGKYCSTIEHSGN